MVNIYQPRMMLEALKQIKTPRRFLRETFFARNTLHTTETVELDIYKGKRSISAFVNPIHDGVIVERDGFETKVTRPAYTKEKTAIRPGDTRQRAMGENIYAASTPQQRAAQMLGEDLAMLENRLARLEEKMCADALITGKVIVKGEGWDAQVDFGYTTGDNIKVLSGTSCWDKDDAKIIKNLDDWRREINKRCGVAPTHAILGSGASAALLESDKIQKLLDNARIVMGAIAPQEQAGGVSHLGRLMLPSGAIELYSYDEWYIDPTTEKESPMIPEDVVLLGSSNARAEFNYGMIQNHHHLGAAARFPLSWVTDDGAARWVQLESAPMPNLYQVDAFTVAHVLSDK